jgi:ClpP class serine protease
MMLAASVSYSQVCTDCIPIPRSTFELSKKAVDEVKASRVLIDKQATEIDLLRENVALKDQVIKLLTENGQLKDERGAEKDKQIAAEKSAREATEKQLTIETKEKEKAQRSAKFWRKIGTAAGAALAAVFLPKLL